MTDADLAARIAEGAGAILLAVRAAGLIEGKALGAAGDRIANAFILDALQAQRPDDAVLSEESVDTTDRLEQERVWIVDPLDGTREYSEGREDWAVHIALAIGGRPALGAVALPAQGLVLRSDAPPALPALADGPVRLLVSRTRPPAEAERVAEALGAELVPMGSAGAKAMAVLLGQGDVYLHAGGQYEWDNCAPAAVALGAGLHATRLDGSPLEYNRADPKLPDLLICHRSLAERVRAALA
ncbi:MAG TPA: 3'(2'),5'-bisphosphate nucleotidase CysQ [Allosphingosinicella sp.]|jgi:3'(2'), 5'-bisphosphate nucleotidase